MVTRHISWIFITTTSNNNNGHVFRPINNRLFWEVEYKIVCINILFFHQKRSVKDTFQTSSTGSLIYLLRGITKWIQKRILLWENSLSLKSLICRLRCHSTLHDQYNIQCDEKNVSVSKAQPKACRKLRLGDWLICYLHHLLSDIQAKTLFF